MQLHYVRHLGGNFGDELNAWIWPRLLGRPLTDCLDDDTVLVGIGSMLNSRLRRLPSRRIVLGAGIGYGEPRLPAGEWQWLCVRGPRTRDALGLPSDTTLGDSAVLIREFFAPVGRLPARAAFMPHVETSFRGDWKALCDDMDIGYVDPRGDTERVIGEISGTGLLVTESLHGAIVADALRIPWVPVRTNDHILGLKWEDWLGAFGMAHAFVDMPGLLRPRLPRKLRGLVRQAGWKMGRYVSAREARLGIYARTQAFGWTTTEDRASVRRSLAEILRSGSARRSDDHAFASMYAGVTGSLERLRRLIEEGRPPQRVA